MSHMADVTMDGVTENTQINQIIFFYGFYCLIKHVNESDWDRLDHPNTSIDGKVTQVSQL